MNAALFWKEYRQQRVLWLTVLLVATFVAASFSATLQRRSEADVAVTYSLMVIAVVYGIAVGALAMAGEKEDGTLDFLDNLTARRSTIWWRKLAAGMLLVLSQSSALAVLALVVGFDSSENALIMFAAGLNGMAWGLLAGALCRTVLIAVLTGIVFMISSLLLPIIVTAFRLLMLELSILVAAGLGLAAFYASWRIFCRDDFSRRPARLHPLSRFVEAIPASWRSILRLTCWEGRWALAAVVAGAAAELSCQFRMANCRLAGRIAAAGIDVRNGRIRSRSKERQAIPCMRANSAGELLDRQVRLLAVDRCRRNSLGLVYSHGSHPVVASNLEPSQILRQSSRRFRVAGNLGW